MFVKTSTVGYHEDKIKELKEKLEVTSKIEDKRLEITGKAGSR